jgi:hypothetical protein
MLMTKKKTKNVIDKSFLDTSVLRPYQDGPDLYREFLIARMKPGTPYVSKYVNMEYRRGFTMNLLSIYDALGMSNLETISDVQKFLGENFSSRKITAINNLFAELANSYEFRFSYPSDKEKARKVVLEYVKRLEWKLKNNIDVGTDPVRCSRAKVEFNTNLGASDGVSVFRKSFDDPNHSKLCRVSDFILVKKRVAVDGYISQDATGTQGNGYNKIRLKLQKAVAKGKEWFTCKNCAMIGDAIIALAASDDMQLEHTDHSFDFLCLPIKQPHQKHPPMTMAIGSSQTPDSESEP